MAKSTTKKKPVAAEAAAEWMKEGPTDHAVPGILATAAVVADTEAVQPGRAKEPLPLPEGLAAHTTNGRLPSESPRGKYALVAVEQIDPFAHNPRTIFDEVKLAELAESIRQHGVLQPIVVAGIPSSGPRARFPLIMGERRYRAAKQIGLSHIPAIVREVASEAEALELALIENLHREDITPTEEAWGYKKLSEMGYTQTQIALRVGCSQNTISHRLRLLDLPDDVQARIAKKELTPSHGEALAALTEIAPAAVSKIAEVVAEQKIPTTVIEKYVPDSVGQKLVSERLAHNVLNAKFNWQEHCLKCPFHAFKAAGSRTWEGGYCFKPEHFRELNKEARDREKTRKEEEESRRREKAIQAGLDPDAKMRPFSWSMTDLRGKSVPGCTKDCPCRAVADYYGTLIPVCTDRERYNRLMEAEKLTIREREERKADGRIRLVLTRLERIHNLNEASHELALVAGAFLADCPEEVMRTTLISMGLIDTQPESFTPWKNDFLGNAPCGSKKGKLALAKQPALLLFRLILELAARQECAHRIDHYVRRRESTDTPILSWLLKIPETAHESGSDRTTPVEDEPEENETEICARCSEEIAKDLLGCSVIEARKNGVQVLESGVIVTAQGELVCPSCATGEEEDTWSLPLCASCQKKPATAGLFCAECGPAREPELVTTTAEDLVG